MVKLWLSHKKDGKTIKLYLIRPREDLTTKAFGFVIRAKNENEARKLAYENGHDEKNGWLDSKYSTCEELKNDGEAGLIMEDFHAA